MLVLRSRGSAITREHVLSEANFGGRLISPGAACQPCNGLAGRVEALAAEHPRVAEAVGQVSGGRGASRFPQSPADQ
jgi:hypothetical protein